MKKVRTDNNGQILKRGEYQRKDGSYEHKYYDKDNKRRSVYSDTLEELRSKAEKLAEVKSNSVSGEETVTLAMLFKHWKEIKRGIQDNTFQNYVYLFEKYVLPELGDTKLSELRTSEIKMFYSQLLDRGLRIGTLTNIQNVLHQVLDLGVEDEYLSRNPSDHALRELKRNAPKSKKKALTEEQQARMEAFLSTEKRFWRWVNMIMVLLWTGLRIGELTGLRWCDVDFEKGEIIVNHTLVYYDHGAGKGCGFGINRPKTPAGNRIIPMLPKVRQALLEEREYLEKSGITCKLAVDGYTDFIFLNRFGRPYHQGIINRQLKLIIAACNVAGEDTVSARSNRDEVPGDRGMQITLSTITNHSLRHSFATRLWEYGVDVKIIQTILGHADIKVTMNIYTDVTKSFTNAVLKDFVNRCETAGHVQELS